MGEKKQLYMDVAKEADAPINKRSPISIGRSGVERIPRCYHLKPEDIIRIKKEAAERGRFISPYGSGRIYSFIIEALVLLGENNPHPVHLIFDKFKELANHESTKDENGRTLLQRFEGKAPRNLKTARTPLAKFVQNIEVLQRLGGRHPYAFKLAQVGACIDVLVGADSVVKVMLRTGIPDGDPVRPVNMNRKRNYTKTVDEVASGIVIDSDKMVA